MNRGELMLAVLALSNEDMAVYVQDTSGRRHDVVGVDREVDAVGRPRIILFTARID